MTSAFLIFIGIMSVSAQNLTPCEEMLVGKKCNQIDKKTQVFEQCCKNNSSRQNPTPEVQNTVNNTSGVDYTACEAYLHNTMRREKTGKCLLSLMEIM